MGNVIEPVPEVKLAYWRVVLAMEVTVVPTSDEGGLYVMGLLPELAGHAVHTPAALYVLAGQAAHAVVLPQP